MHGLSMKIRFSKHITRSHREGSVGEIAEITAVEQLDKDTYLIIIPKAKSSSTVVEFLRQEERIRNLELDESFTT